MPVLELIFSRLPATLELTVAAVLGATLLGIPLGMYAGYKPHGMLSKLIMGLSILGFSVPTFWVGLVLIFTFAVSLGWLPAGGRGETVVIGGIAWSFLTLDGLSHLLLPAFNLALFKLAMLIRLARAGTREVMLTDTVKFASAAGESEWTILRQHVLRLISIPLVTVFGLEFGSTLAFAVVTETIFSWPGIGKLIIDSISGARPPGDGRLSDARRPAVHHDQFPGRHRLCRSRPAPARAKVLMDAGIPLARFWQRVLREPYCGRGARRRRALSVGWL